MKEKYFQKTTHKKKDSKCCLKNKEPLENDMFSLQSNQRSFPQRSKRRKALTMKSAARAKNFSSPGPKRHRGLVSLRFYYVVLYVFKKMFVSLLSDVFCMRFDVSLVYVLDVFCMYYIYICCLMFFV